MGLGSVRVGSVHRYPAMLQNNRDRDGTSQLHLPFLLLRAEMELRCHEAALPQCLLARGGWITSESASIFSGVAGPAGPAGVAEIP